MKRFYIRTRHFIWLLLPAFLIAGFFQPLVGFAALICMFSPIIISLFRGRRSCGYVCPRAAFHDIPLGGISLNRKMPRLFTNRVFKTAFFLVIMGAFAVSIAVSSSLEASGGVFVRMVFITTGLAIIGGAIITPRAWCTVCPVGKMSAGAARFRNKARNKD